MTTGAAAAHVDEPVKESRPASQFSTSVSDVEDGRVIFVGTHTPRSSVAFLTRRRPF